MRRKSQDREWRTGSEQQGSGNNVRLWLSTDLILPLFPSWVVCFPVGLRLLAAPSHSVKSCRLLQKSWVLLGPKLAACLGLPSSCVTSKRSFWDDAHVLSSEELSRDWNTIFPEQDRPCCPHPHNFPQYVLLQQCWLRHKASRTQTSFPFTARKAEHRRSSCDMRPLIMEDKKSGISFQDED